MSKKPILLTDLAAPENHEVKTSRGMIVIDRLSAADVARILTKSPAIFSLFSGGGSVKLSKLLSDVPDAAAHIIAIACDMDNEDGIKAASRLIPADALEILLAVADISFPGGISSFLGRLTAMAEGQEVAEMAIEASQSDPALAAMVAD